VFLSCAWGRRNWATRPPRVRARPTCSPPKSLAGKPSVVLSDYPGHLVEERSEGLFHGSIGFQRLIAELLEENVRAKKTNPRQKESLLPHRLPNALYNTPVLSELLSAS
jgi:hypothetical protein